MEAPPARRSIWREPLVHFVLAGALLFALQRARAATRPAAHAPAAGERSREIIVSDGYLAGLRAQHRLRTGHDPSAAEEAALVQDYVREEALYREARAARLDVGDAIVRRRLVQKMEFFVGSEVRAPEPTEPDLERWLEAHGDALREAPRVAFEHVLFARDRRGAHTLADARAALGAVRAAASQPARSALGDPFILGYLFPSESPRDVIGTFGPAFAESLEGVAAGVWTGPIESTYGAHLVRVESRTPGRVPPLAEVRDVVRRRWLDEQRERLTREALARIVAGYHVARVREAAP